MTEKAGIEKRVFERKAYRRAIYLLEANKSALKVRTIDISLGGVSLISPTNFSLSTCFMIQMDLPSDIKGGSMPMKVQVQLKSSIFSRDEDGFRLGLKFINPTPQFMTSIVKLLKT